MTFNTDALAKAPVLSTRPLKESFSDLGAVSLALLAILFPFLLWAAGWQYAELIAVATVAGEELIEHIGWGFGVIVPALLGFYAIVVGGQIALPTEESVRLRKSLGALSIVLTAALVPALCLIVVACFANPAVFSVILVILPAAGVTLFLAVKLGGFVVFEESKRLEMAIQSKKDAALKLSKLGRCGKRTIWAVIAAHVGVGAIVATVVAVSIGWIPDGADSFAELAIWVSLFAILTGALALLATRLFSQRELTMSRSGRGSFVALLVAVLTGFVWWAVVSSLDESSWPIGFTLFAVLAILTIPVLWPRTRSPQFLLNWGVKGAGAAYAKRSLEKTRALAEQEIEELTPTVESVLRPSLATRLQRALQELRAE